jgi:hypothetical protein
VPDTMLLPMRVVHSLMDQELRIFSALGWASSAES